MKIKKIKNYHLLKTALKEEYKYCFYSKILLEGTSEFEIDHVIPQVIWSNGILLSKCFTILEISPFDDVHDIRNLVPAIANKNKEKMFSDKKLKKILESHPKIENLDEFNSIKSFYKHLHITASRRAQNVEIKLAKLLREQNFDENLSFVKNEISKHSDLKSKTLRNLLDIREYSDSEEKNSFKFKKYKGNLGLEVILPGKRDFLISGCLFFSIPELKNLLISFSNNNILKVLFNPRHLELNDYLEMPTHSSDEGKKYSFHFGNAIILLKEQDAQDLIFLINHFLEVYAKHFEEVILKYNLEKFPINPNGEIIICELSYEDYSIFYSLFLDESKQCHSHNIQFKLISQDTLLVSSLDKEKWFCIKIQDNGYKIQFSYSLEDINFIDDYSEFNFGKTKNQFLFPDILFSFFKDNYEEPILNEKHRIKWKDCSPFQKYKYKNSFSHFKNSQLHNGLSVFARKPSNIPYYGSVNSKKDFKNWLSYICDNQSHYSKYVKVTEEEEDSLSSWVGSYYIKNQKYISNYLISDLGFGHSNKKENVLSNFKRQKGESTSIFKTIKLLSLIRYSLDSDFVELNSENISHFFRETKTLSWNLFKFSLMQEMQEEV